MNLDKLIGLKSFLESLREQYIVLYTKDGNIIGDEVKCSRAEFINNFNEDASKVVGEVTSIFKRIIKWCCINNIEYEKLIINPSFGFLVAKDDYDEENGRINNTDGILGDAVFVNFYNMFYVDNGIKKELNYEEIFGRDSLKNYVVLFSEFMEILDDNGLDFGKSVNFYGLMADSTSLEIAVDFSRRIRTIRK